MSNCKQLIEAAKAAGDHEYAAWLTSRRCMTSAELRPRAAYHWHLLRSGLQTIDSEGMNPSLSIVQERPLRKMTRKQIDAALQQRTEVFEKGVLVGWNCCALSRRNGVTKIITVFVPV